MSKALEGYFAKQLKIFSEKIENKEKLEKEINLFLQDKTRENPRFELIEISHNYNDGVLSVLVIYNDFIAIREV